MIYYIIWFHSQHSLIFYFIGYISTHFESFWYGHRSKGPCPSWLPPLWPQFSMGIRSIWSFSSLWKEINDRTCARFLNIVAETILYLVHDSMTMTLIIQQQWTAGLCDAVVPCATLAALCGGALKASSLLVDCEGYHNDRTKNKRWHC